MDGPAGGSRRRNLRGWLIAGLLLCLLIAIAGMEFGRDRRAATAAEAGPDRAPAFQIASVLSKPVIEDVGLPLPVASAGSLRAPERGSALRTLVSDDDEPTSGMWSVSTNPGRTSVRRLLPTAGARTDIVTAGEPEAVDVARWRRDGPVAAFLLDERRDGTVAVDVHDPARGGSRIGRYVAQVPPRPPGAERTLQIGHWTGDRADLYVVDRALPGGEARVEILSGESGFRSTVLAVPVLVGSGFPRRAWSMDLRDVAGTSLADIVFTSRSSRTESKRVEVHVLASQTLYSRFLLQVPTANAAQDSPPERTLTGTIADRPVWLLIHPATGQVRVHPLRAPAPERRARR
jgi:hypothetical protein